MQSNFHSPANATHSRVGQGPRELTTMRASMITSSRRSKGGQVVKDSLDEAGFDIATPGVSLVETAPALRRYDAVLLQNAWDVINWRDFLRELRPYPLRMRWRAHLRRLVSRWNMLRARKVVCLTYAVATQLKESTGIAATVAPVTIPIHDWPDQVTITQPDEPYAFVSGSVTWYKRPHQALPW